MKINRDNYEELFLLYVDNELSEWEKNAVEQFVSENLDLKEELMMLQQSVLPRDPINYTGKESLFREESIATSLQQELVLLLDNELDNTSREKMLSLIVSNNAVKKEWELLQQTRLDKADKIIFSDKGSLYKKETTPVIAIRWRYIAAAAVIIGVAVWSIQSYFEKPAGHLNVNTAATQPSKSTSQAPTEVNDQPLVAGEQKRSVQETKGLDNSRISGQIAATPAKQKNNHLNGSQQQHTTSVLPVPEIVSTSERPSSRLSEPTVENNNPTESNIANVSTVSPTALNNIKIDNAISNANLNESALPRETATTNQFAVQTTDAEQENNLEEEDNSGVKSKLGGFFKKIKRVVERKTNMQSGDRSIKIANMSFAVK